MAVGHQDVSGQPACSDLGLHFQKWAFCHVLSTELLSCTFVIVAESSPYFPESLVSAWLSGQGFRSSRAEVLPCSGWPALEHPSSSGRLHHQQPDLSAACSRWTRLAPGWPIAMLHHPTYFTLLTPCRPRWLVSPECLFPKRLPGLQRQVFSLSSNHLT